MDEIDNLHILDLINRCQLAIGQGFSLTVEERKRIKIYLIEGHIFSGEVEYGAYPEIMSVGSYKDSLGVFGCQSKQEALMSLLEKIYFLCGKNNTDPSDNG